jgi:pseudouridine kinase
MEKQKSQRPDFITVIGAVNVDIAGTSFEPVIERDSNPGRISVSLGGVGRNIAENLSRLQVPVRLMTVTGDDAYGLLAEKSCRELGIDLTYSLRIPGETTSTYLCLNDSDGELCLAVNDMEICRHLSPAYLAERMEEINRSALVVVDANLAKESIDYLSEQCTVPLFADPVSVKKASRLKDSLHHIYGIKPNRPEAEVLTGVAIHTYSDLDKAAQVLLEKGVKQVFISLGADGVYYNDGLERGILPCYPGRRINTTGCGDAFMAAAAFGCCLGKPVKVIASMGLAAAALCAGAQDAVYTGMSYKLLESKMMENGGKTL